MIHHPNIFKSYLIPSQLTPPLSPDSEFNSSSLASSESNSFIESHSYNIWVTFFKVLSHPTAFPHPSVTLFRSLSPSFSCIFWGEPEHFLLESHWCHVLIIFLNPAMSWHNPPCVSQLIYTVTFAPHPYHVFWSCLIVNRLIQFYEPIDFWK